MSFAERKFLELGMDKTAERNAILIFVAPRAQKFAVVGDEAIHQKCGEKFWQRLVERMREHFKARNLPDALVEGIEKAGKLLGTQFPQTSENATNCPTS